LRPFFCWFIFGELDGERKWIESWTTEGTEEARRARRDLVGKDWGKGIALRVGPRRARSGHGGHGGIGWGRMVGERLRVESGRREGTEEAERAEGDSVGKDYGGKELR